MMVAFSYATLLLIFLLGTLLFAISTYFLDQYFQRQLLIEKEFIYKEYQFLFAELQLTNSLLLNILPKPVIDKLLKHPTTIAHHYKNVTVLFADVVNFVTVSSTLSAKELVQLLDEIFSSFDVLCDKYKIEKIKTIGDGYMAAAGIPETNQNHAVASVKMALEMQQVIQEFNKTRESPLQLRIGIHTGPLVAGVIGKKKFVYDLWGDTVNIASRMESNGLPTKIQISQQTFEQLHNSILAVPRGEISIKGKGKIKTFLIQPPS